MIAAGVLFVFEVLFLKETRGAKILTRRAKQMRKETGNQNIRAPAELESESVKDLLKKSSTRALMLLVKEPVILFFGFWIAVSSQDGLSWHMCIRLTLLLAQMAWGITFAFLSVVSHSVGDVDHKGAESKQFLLLQDSIDFRRQPRVVDWQWRTSVPRSHPRLLHRVRYWHVGGQEVLCRPESQRWNRRTRVQAVRQYGLQLALASWPARFQFHAIRFRALGEYSWLVVLGVKSTICSREH